MAHKLGAAFLKSRKSGRKGLLIQSACETKPEKMIGHSHAAALAHAPVERISQSAWKFRVRRGPVEREPDKRNPELLRQADHNLEHARNDVGMFMGIKMAGRDAGRDDLLNLGPQLGVDIQVAADERGHYSAGSFGKRTAGDQRIPLHKNEMAPDVEGRRLAGKTNRVLKRISISHERCGSEYAFAMRVNDARIYVTREAEIIGIDN